MIFTTPVDGRVQNKAMKLELSLLSVLVHILPRANGQTAADVKRLRTKLFVTDGYNKRIRPTDNQTQPIEVSVSFYMSSMNELNEVTETLQSAGFLHVTWNDSFLRWNPSDFGGIQMYLFPQKDIWRPDVTLKNSYLDYKELGVDSLNVESYYDGRVNWYPSQVFHSTCSVDITKFPFDVQTCYFKFVAWSYTQNSVKMKSGSTGIILEDYVSNSEWDIVSTSWKKSNVSFETAITFELKIKRKPQYVLLAVVFPIIMLALLNICVFVLPCESGERASYAITVFLSFAVFMTIISSTLPENSENIPVFSIFLIIQTVSSTLITVIALVMIRVSGKDDAEPVPRCLIIILLALACRRCETPAKSYHEPKNLPANVMESDVRQKTISWKETVTFLDRIFFVFFLLIFFLSTLLTFAAAALV